MMEAMLIVAVFIYLPVMVLLNLLMGILNHYKNEKIE